MSSQIENTMSSIRSDSSVACCRPMPHMPGLLGRIVDFFLLWQAREADRAHLVSLPDYLLQDMGLSREDVEAGIRP